VFRKEPSERKLKIVTMSNLILTQGRTVSSSSSEEELPPPNPHRVKRALFGPTDHEENLRFVRNELKKARSEAANRWNFDFDTERPMDGRYNWEEVRSISAVTAVLNPEKHVRKEKENRVSQADTDSSVESLSAPTNSIDDLKTPPQTSEPEPSSSSSPSSSSGLTSNLPSLPSHGAKSQTKEKKISEMYRSRKPRSKSSTKLKLKRLGDEGGGSRSPSVKSRVKEGGVKSDTVKKPVTSSKLDDSNSSSD